MSIDRRVGVVGLYHSGKTVFLTSLINHLRDHDPDICPIWGGNEGIEGFRELKPEGIEAFDYARYRQSLVERHSWPEKTRAVAEYRCEFKRTRDGSSQDVRLSLLDIPGERLADMSMARMSYAGWSDELLKFFEIRPEYRGHAGDYLAMLEAGDADGAKLLAGYKTLLAGLILDYKPVVTPSTFLVDRDGGYPGEGDRTLERLAQTRCCGACVDREFAPLDAKAREQWPETARAFEQNFNDYKREIVGPISEWLTRCDALVVLVDVTTLLAAGLGMYEGNRELLGHLMRAADPGRSVLGRIADTVARFVSLGWLRFPAIEKIAFVAGKADKVLRDDRQRMHGLLRSMTRKLTSGIEGVATEWFVCSAVDSTEPHANGKLEGYVRRSGEHPDAGPEAFEPSRVPDNWPDNWHAGEFHFPDVRPVMPARRDAPPRHIGMHRLMRYILDE